MRTMALLSTAAAALLLGAGTVAAQSGKEQPRPERAPAAQQNAPAEKLAPSMHSGKSSETTGQGASEVPSGTSKPHAGMNRNNSSTTGAAPKSDLDKSGTEKSETDRSRMNKSGQSESNKSEMKKNETNGQAGIKNEERSGSKSRSTTIEERNGQTAPRQRGTVERDTTGQGAAGSSTKLSTQQRTKITSIIKEKNVEPTHLNISVHVGARVPASVHFYPLPTEVVEVYPQWRGYDYILVADEILIIDPASHEIVAILNV